MKSEIELLELLKEHCIKMDADKSVEFFGMCDTIREMTYANKIGLGGSGVLKRILKKYQPSKESRTFRGDPDYFFKPCVLSPRIEFIDMIINILRK